MAEITSTQLKAVAMILGLPASKNRVELVQEIQQALNKYKRTLATATATTTKTKTNKSLGKRKSTRGKGKSLEGSEISKSVRRRSHPSKSRRRSQGSRRQKSRKSTSHKKRNSTSRKSTNYKKRNSTSRKSTSYKKRNSTSRKAVKGFSKSRSGHKHGKEFDRFKAAIQRVAQLGFTEVVTALVNKSAHKAWIMLRKPNSTKADDRVTIWGNLKGGEGPRHLYGVGGTNEKEFIQRKMNLGYEKDGDLMRVARRAVRE